MRFLMQVFRQLFLGKTLHRKGDKSSSRAAALQPSLGLREDVPEFYYPVFWFTQDSEQVAEHIHRLLPLLGGGLYFGDNLLTWGKNISPLSDSSFVDSWQRNAESPSDYAIVWRRHILATLAFHALQLPGDFVECGAYTGVGVKTILDYLGGTSFPKTFWAYDIFEHDSSMANHAMPEHGPDLYEKVCQKFSLYPQVRVMKGLIPEVFYSGCPDQISYLHIDLNQAPAEVSVLEHLFDRVVPGGVIIFDDYEWSGIYRPQKLAEDDWLGQRQYKVTPLPTGQGFIIKR